MRTALSLLFWTFFAVSLPPMFVGALVVWAATLPLDPDRRALHLYSCFWAQLYFYVNPTWRLRIEGRQHLPRRGPAVIVSNHESLGDVLVLFGLYRPFKWVSKQSVFRIPFLGWNMRLNRYVPLQRGNKESITRMMEQSRAWLDRGVPVLLFPEGTRSPDGQVQAFKDGAFRLAIEKGCPVIPVVLTGTARTLPKHGLVLEPWARCLVRVLPPVDPARFRGDVAALREHVRSAIVEEKARLLGEPRRAAA